MFGFNHQPASLLRCLVDAFHARFSCRLSDPLRVLLFKISQNNDGILRHAQLEFE